MTFEDYKSGGRSRYADFVDAIRRIIAASVAAHQMVPHAITGRAKETESLAKKLENRGIGPDAAIGDMIKDLAGARVVFLTNSQIDAFNRAGAIHENFDVVDVNVHHAVPGTESETRLFDSTNYLVTLKAERLALPEYAPFAGLRAEIQVQTLLNHAWAEMGHDTIYKQPDLQRVGQKGLAAIKVRLDRVMREYLVPAGHDFEKIARDFHRLVQADSQFDPAIETLTKSADNNALGDAIESLGELILPQTEARCAEFRKLAPRLVAAVARARAQPTVPIETIYYDMPGRSGENVAIRASRLIADHRFCDPPFTLDALLTLYSGAVSDAERKTWVDLAKRFASHDLDIWEKHGPAIPELILDRLEAMDGRALGEISDVSVVMLERIVSPDIAGMAGSSSTVTIKRAAVAPTDAVALIRSRAIALLERLLDAAPGDDARKAALGALRKAAEPPYAGASAELRAMIMEDAARVLGIERARLGQWSLELRRKAEASALRIHDRFRALPPDVAKDAAAIEAQAALLAEIGAFREDLASDAEYQIYKLLIGRDSVRPDAWNERAFDHRATGAWRDSEFANMLEQISEETVGDWLARVRRFMAEIGSKNGEHIWPLQDFLRRLGEAKPRLAVTFLYEMGDDIALLLTAVLEGIDRAGERDLIRRHTARWMGEGRFLTQIAAYLSGQEPFDFDMLESLGARAIALGDSDGVNATLIAAARRYDVDPNRRFIDRIVFPAIDHLVASRAPHRIDHALAFADGGLVRALDEEEARRLLDAFVAIPEIDYEADEQLALVAERFPALIIDFFDTRCRLDGEQRGRNYEAIPFSMHRVHEVLAAHPALMVEAARRWYADEPDFHIYRGGRLLAHVFPDVAGDFAEILSRLVAVGDRHDIAFVISTLAAYDGSETIYALAMDIVAAIEPGDSLIASVGHALDQWGVTTGEFGLVAASAERIGRIERWENDPRPRVRAYTHERHRRLEQSMAAEQRRAERETEQRKRDWNEA